MTFFHWNVRWKNDKRRIDTIKALQETGQNLPEDYIDQPDLPEHLHHILSAFNELDSDRSFIPITTIGGISIMPTPIPFNSIVQYAKIYEYMDSFDSFVYLLRAIDNAYIEFEKEKIGNG